MTGASAAQVFRGGGGGDSSGEEEDGEVVAVDAEDLQLPPDLLDMDDGPNAAPFVPTPEVRTCLGC